MSPDQTVQLLVQVQADIADIAKLVNGMKGVSDSFEDTGKKIKTGFFLEIGKMAAQIALDVPKQLFEVAKSALEMGDRLHDISDQLNISAESFQVLANAAKEAGVEQNMFVRTITEMKKSINNARENTGGAAVQFEQLGISVGAIINLPVEEQFTAIAKSINGASDKAAAFKAVTEIFGQRTGPQMEALLKRLGKEGFGGLSTEIEGTWGIMKDSTAAALDQMSDKFDQLKNRLIIAVGEALPKLQPLIDGFSVLAGWIIKCVEGITAMAVNLGQNVGLLIYGQEARDASIKAEQAAIEAEEKAAKARRASGGAAAESKDVQELAMAERALSNILAIKAQFQARITENAEKQARINSDSFLTEKEKQQKLLPLLQSALKLREEANEVIRAQSEELQKIDDLQSKGFRTGQDNSPGAVASRAVINLKEGQALSPTQLAAMQDQNKRFTEMQGVRGELAQGQSSVQSIGQQASSFGFMGELKDRMREMKDGFATIASSIAETFQTAFSSISSNLTAVIMQTKTWGQAFAAIGTTILTSVVGAIVQMSVQWVARKIIEFTLGNTLRAAAIAANAGTALALSAMWVVPATLATIASFGGAAVQAPITMAGAIASAAPLALFDKGGYTGDGGVLDPAGIVHKGEVVFSQRDINRLGGVAAVEAFRVAGGPQRGGAGISANGSGGAGPALGSNGGVNMAFFNTKQDAETWLASQNGRRVMTDFMRGQQFEL